jgi:acyl carrier protein
MTQTQLSRDDLQELVADILDVEPEALTDDSHFVDDFGVDSLIALELAVALERRYGVRIAEEEIAQVRRMPDVVALVQRKVGA